MGSLLLLVLDCSVDDVGGEETECVGEGVVCEALDVDVLVTA